MRTFEDRPSSLVGTYINGVALEKALVERVYCTFYYPSSLKAPIHGTLSEWVFLVGIYRSKEDYYLLLEENDQSSTVNQMINECLFPNTGLLLISKEKAMELTERISKLGSEFFSLSVPNFQELISAMVSSMKCKIRFDVLLDMGGYYIPSRNEIVVAKNNTQMGIIFSLVHEYVHFLRNSKRRSKRKIPQTYEEYEDDKEEDICNRVARAFLVKVLDRDIVQGVGDGLASKMQLRKDGIKAAQQDVVFSKEEELFLCFPCDKKTQKACNRLLDHILGEFEAQKDTKTSIDCSQSGLVRLSREDNEKLIDMILKEISPMMPAYEEWDDEE